MLTIRVCQRSPAGSWVNLAVVALCDDEIIFFINVPHKGPKRTEDMCRFACNDKALQRSSHTRSCVRAWGISSSAPPLSQSVRKSVRSALIGSARRRLCASLRTCLSCFNRSGSFFFFLPTKRDLIRATGLFFSPMWSLTCCNTKIIRLLDRSSGCWMRAFWRRLKLR